MSPPALTNPDSLAVSGEQDFDIRDFDIAIPTVLMFRIYPDVMVRLQIEAKLDRRERGTDPMKVFVALAAGYLLGASAGSRDFDELLDSVRAIRDSEEFHDFLAALRSHASATLRELADMLERTGTEGLQATDLVERVKALAVRG